MEKHRKRKKKFAAAAVFLFVLLAAGGVFLYDGAGSGGRTEKERGQKEQTDKENVYDSMSPSDRQMAEAYAVLYETPAAEVAMLQKQTGDWEKTNEKLEEDFFTISENTKYQLSLQGYRMEDMYEAERLAVKTGRRAMELLREKGTASEDRSWDEVLKEEDR